MPNTYKDKGLTGKSTRKRLNVKATVLVGPVVEQTDLAKEGHHINDAATGGKQFGALVLNHASGKLAPAIATGSKEQDLWKTVAAASVTVITPGA